MPSSVLRKNRRVVADDIAIRPSLPSLLSPFPATLLMLDLREQKAQRQKGGREEGRGGPTKGLGVLYVSVEVESRERILKFLLILHFFSSKSPSLLVFPVEEKRGRAFNRLSCNPTLPPSHSLFLRQRKGKGPRASKTGGGTGAEKEGRGWSEGEEQGEDYDCH